MLLEHLDHAEAARAVVAAVERLVEEGKTLTRDSAVVRRPRGRAGDRGAALARRLA